MPNTPSPAFETQWNTLFGSNPYPWQTKLASDPNCQNRLIHIPTGFGKTQAVLGAWIYRRLVRQDPSWPRRLVWCLPMRVLVEQSLEVARSAIENAGLLWDGKEEHHGRVGVHALMGGEESGEWHLHPEADAILIGTQDMLLSRALNRGYAAHRARWPIDLGLLSQDALWVLDEVQLMDVGLATSAQLQCFRDQLAPKSLRPARSWWMSATLQRSWLESVDNREEIASLPVTTLSAEEKKGRLWEQTQKSCGVESFETVQAWGESIAKKLLEEGEGRLSLIVVNRVKTAVELQKQLIKLLKDTPLSTHLRLIHSRFRPAERASWREDFLSLNAPIPDEGRVIIATQVVEAGVDIDAQLLFTELAPWPNLVQRFGRAARRGGEAKLFVADLQADTDKGAAPYRLSELQSSRLQLSRLEDVSPAQLDLHDSELTEQERASLYPYAPAHLLLEQEWHELFDTSADLSGADVDISRFIRSGDERDVMVFWREDLDEKPSKELRPNRTELCAVPFLDAREWLLGKKGKRSAWVWDWLSGAWTRLYKKDDIYPGRLLLIDSKTGGYDPLLGWDAKCSKEVPEANRTTVAHPQDDTDGSEENERLSEKPWKTIGTHTREVADTARQLAIRAGLPPEHQEMLALAARWHDVGKSHPAFQGSMRDQSRPHRQDLAKGPDQAWSRKYLYQIEGSKEARPGFRHELASMLALFEVLRRHQPQHPALLGPWREHFELLGIPIELSPVSEAPPTTEEQAVLALDGPQFDLLAWLVVTHHGKIHSALHPSPKDQDAPFSAQRGQPLRGIFENDRLPSLAFSPGESLLPSTGLRLSLAGLGLSPSTGRSWTERVQSLMDGYGPTTLALLEACLRAADARASRLTTHDPVLTAEAKGLEGER